MLLTWFFWGCLSLPAPVTAPGAAGTEPFVYDGYSMGTALHLEMFAPPGAAASAAAAVAAEFARLDRLLTTYAHPGWQPSDLQRLHDAAGSDPIRIDPSTFEVLQAAQQMSQASNGAFDVSVGALETVWQFHATRAVRVPAARRIEQARRLVDYRRLILSPEGPTAQLQLPGMRLTLGGIAKGYAVDRGVALLRRAGIHNFLIKAGGDLFVSGSRQGAPWRIGLHDPSSGPQTDARARPLRIVELSNKACSTSGDYERGFDWHGKRYHHILDPRTGWPTTGLRSVSVVAPSAMLADAVGDALMVLGKTAAQQLVRQLPQVRAYLVDAAGALDVVDAKP
jgi:thiamine biosynthesis lipoprotein